MNNSLYKFAQPVNEPIRSYAKGSSERESLLSKYNELYHKQLDIPMYIGGNEVRTHIQRDCYLPHEHKHFIGRYHIVEEKETALAIEAALKAKLEWENMPFTERASIFLKAAELISVKYRDTLNAATMLCQSKNIHQAEIDSACELIDFLRFNVYFASEIYAEQPISTTGVLNRVSYRALEGFVYAITPFNFTAIAGNLPCSAALMGNCVVWKPSNTQVYSAHFIMQILIEAGLPGGVINLINGPASPISSQILSHPSFAGVHFTGSSSVFCSIWKEIGNNISKYKTYPRIVGETGGKDYILAHKSANVDQIVTAIVRGAFEYQGQKCSAASRAYIPSSLWGEVSSKLKDVVSSLKIGPPSDPSSFITAVITEQSFDKIVSYIDRAKDSSSASILVGGGSDKSVGYFIEPTVIVATDHEFITMKEELFGPVMTIFVYEDSAWNETLALVDSSPYALTGAILSKDRFAIIEVMEKLQNSAGNFYINDKPTGAVVGQQPFGGARASGTNDKAGSKLNLLRWTSVRLVKETFLTPESYEYPYLEV